MRSSMLIMLAPFVGPKVVSGFIAQTRRSESIFTRSRVQVQLKMPLYVDEPSMLSSLPSDEAIFILSMISDDDSRRKTVKSYLLDGLAREQSLLETGSCWHRDRSTFVRQAREHLKLISGTVQDNAWEKYVTTGCEPRPCQPQQLWACVDMTVQFSKVFHGFNEECQEKAQHAFQ